MIKIEIKILTIMHAWCTHDHENDENNKRNEEKEVGMLRPLRGGVGDSSRWILSAWRLSSAFFTFFFSKDARDGF